MNPISEKGEFLYWSKNGVGPNAWLQMLKQRYSYLSAAYLQKGKKMESQLFAEVAKDFAQIQTEALGEEPKIPSAEV
jgi:hypothetical protein